MGKDFLTVSIYFKILLDKIKSLWYNIYSGGREVTYRKICCNKNQKKGGGICKWLLLQQVKGL